jgi:hypothetical protein
MKSSQKRRKIMGNTTSKNIRALLIMGFIWVGLGLLGLFFDPDKKLIIGSQMVAGHVSFILYFVLKGRSRQPRE